MVKRQRRNTDNPLVFLDITIGGEKIGRIVLELYNDVVPKVSSFIMHAHLNCLHSFELEKVHTLPDHELRKQVCRLLLGNLSQHIMRS